MAPENKAKKMNNESTKKSKKSKKSEELSRRRKNNADSDSDNIMSSDSENEEMDVHEYRKFLSKIFPSKNLDKKIQAGENLKKVINREEDEEDDEIENKKVSNKKTKNVKKPVSTKKPELPKNKSSKIVKKSKKIESEDDEETLGTNDSDDEDEDEDEYSDSDSDSESESESESDSDSDYEEDEDDEELNVKGSKFNIIFTIGGVDEEDEEGEWLDEEDSEWEELSDDETEDEDDSVSSSTSSEPKNKILTRKQKEKLFKTKTQEKSKKCEKKNDETMEEYVTATVDTKENEELLDKLKELFEKNKNNETIKKCLEVCEKDIKMKKANEEKKQRKHKEKNARIFKKILKDKNTMNDFAFFQKLNVEEQKKIIKELKEINKVSRIEKPYRITLLESTMPVLFKSAALKKINSLRYMEPGSGEFYKIKNWVDTFMRIPFDKSQDLPITITDGVEKCHDFMEKTQKILDEAVYGLNDAKMQIMQMLGQLITNPKAIGCAVAIHGPPGTGKTSLVKEGISKILNRPFAFIALGGATDSSFLEGHSYTYEGSSWGKIVQILIDSKCMNPVIYFDELDKISDTPKGEEIAGILTHLTDTSQNSQFHDKYFAEIDFDLSKCLFIFSYNDESKVNPILKDRMYRIQTEGYNQKQKTAITSNYLLPKIRQQVKFQENDIIIPNETIHYIIDNLCNKEDGVRNLKRCLEIIHTKLNLYRLMKPGTNLFEQDMSLKVEFPFTVTRDIVDKLIKNNKDKIQAYHNMYV
jgi:ATP-dependent Lon protease